MRKQLTDYDVKDLIKLAVGAGAYSSSPVWGGKGQSPATNPHAVTSNPTGGFDKALEPAGKAIWDNGGKETWDNVLKPAGKAIWDNGGKETVNTGMNTLHGIGTTATGLANVGAGGIGSIGAGINQGAARFQDAVGLTHDATSMADAFAKPMNQAFVAGLKDTVGGAADTLSGGHYNYDGTEFAGAQPTAPHPGTAVEQMRSDMRDQLGRDSTADMVFRGTNAVGDFAAETAAIGGLGRGINVGAKAIQGSRAAPVLNAAAQTPVVGKPLAATGKWLAGTAPEANMFAKTPTQYARATGAAGLLDEAANAQNHFANAADPVDRPADARAYQEHVTDAFQAQHDAQQMRRSDNTDYTMTAAMMNDPAMANRMQHGAVPREVAPQLVQQSGIVPPEQEANAVAAISANAPSLTAPEATQPNPQGGPSTAQQPPAPAPAAEPAPAQAPAQAQAQPTQQPTQQPAPAQAQPAQTTGSAGAADKAFSPELMTRVQNAKTPEEKQAVQQEVAGTVKQHMDQNPLYKQGLADMQAGRTDTEGAKALQANMDKYKNTMVYDEFEKLKQANPTANLSDPSTYAGFLSQASNTAMSKFNEMPMEHKMLTGLGLGGGLIGILSSLFGDTGMGGGLLGMLGLAAGGMAGAAGGMFGNQAQAATGKLMGDFGSFMGMIPAEARDAKNLMPGSAASKEFEAQVAQTFKTQGPEAAQKLIDARTAQFKPLEQMHATSPEFAHSYLMGMENGPKTPEEAAALYKQLSGQVAQARDPNFLRNKATETATKQVSGLQNMVPAWMRVGARLGKDNIPGAKAFLPTSVQEMIDNASTDPHVIAEREIAKRYAQQPQRETRASMNIAQKIYFKQAAMKAARCWAGYEPVPGKAPYSENSCRPKRKKKTKSKEPAK
jgi:hypothetical protein